MQKKIKIVLTGGHAGTTALAVVEELVRRSDRINWDIYWIGSQKAFEGKTVPTLEAKIFPKLGITYHPIIAGRLQRRFSLWTVPSIAKIPIGFFQSLKLLLKIKPDVILSFGGFAAVPVVIIGFLLRVTVIIHEQTPAIGRANKLSSFFANKIAVAREESKVFFPPKKTVLVGNPILSQFLEVPTKRKIGNPPVIFITCGSRGSSIINGSINEILSQLQKKFSLIHQTGELDFRYFSKRADERYEVHNFIDPTQIDGVYRRSDIIISRAGANTISEINTVGLPAILIPIPWVQNDEQNKNASILVKSGQAIILEEKNLNGKNLLTKILFVYRNWKRMNNKRNKIIAHLDANASKKLVDLVESVLNK